MQLGRGYATLSQAPFDLSEQNNLRFRILTPFLAYCVGLRGNLYIVFPMLVSLFFLSFIYFRLRKNEPPSTSLLITSFICFSTPILFLLHFQGYVDITSYLLIWLIIVFIKNKFTWVFLLALLLLNHDSNVFIIPALAFYYFTNAENKTKAALIVFFGIALALLPFYFYRKYVNAV